MSSAQMYDFVYGGIASQAGTIVNERTIMQVSAAYACIALVSGAVSGLPLNVYRVNVETDERERVKTPLWWILNEEATPQWSAASFWEYMMWSRMLHGDGFALILRGSRNSPNAVGLQPLHPLSVDVREENGGVVYVVFNQLREATGHSPDDILHFPSAGFDGLRSPSPIQYALRNAGGNALAADQYSGAFFKNGAKPDFVLRAPGSLPKEKQEELRESWMRRYSGPGNSHMPAVLTNALDIKELSMTPEDSQLLGTRQFQVEDIARIFGVPPFMIGHTQTTTSWGSGVESMGTGFVKYTLQRHLTKIEQELNRKLFKTARNFVEFNVDGLMRADLAARSSYYRAAAGGSAGPGWMTLDEIRRLENLAPLGGDAGKLTQWSANGTQPAQAARR